MHSTLKSSKGITKSKSQLHRWGVASIKSRQLTSLSKQLNKVLVNGFWILPNFDQDNVFRLVLEGPLFNQYFSLVEVSNFEVASDAFSTFKVGILMIFYYGDIIFPRKTNLIIELLSIFLFQWDWKPMKQVSTQNQLSKNHLLFIQTSKCSRQYGHKNEKCHCQSMTMMHTVCFLFILKCTLLSNTDQSVLSLFLCIIWENVFDLLGWLSIQKSQCSVHYIAVLVLRPWICDFALCFKLQLS